MSSDENQRYTAIIDDILATADLLTISRKKIRQGLEAALGGKDLSEQKASKQASKRGGFGRGPDEHARDGRCIHYNPALD